MRTKPMLMVIGALAVGALVLHLVSSRAYGQANDAMTQARTVATFGLMSPRLLNSLNLTPDQVTKIEAAKNAFRQAQRAYVDEVRVVRKEVGDKLFGPNRVGEADVAAQITKIADLREKILREGFRIALDVRGVLTADQLAKAAQIRNQLQSIQEEVRGLFNENQ
jgi:Spy/CpxP family protein refolding chaperone